MDIHRYILEPYKGINTRHHCPACKSKDKTFSLYIDTETGLHVYESVGRCNRESKCGYHYTPKQYFQNNNISIDSTNHLIRQVPPKREPSFIDDKILSSTLRQYDLNNFVKFLIVLFDENITDELIEKYSIGTSKHWPGSTIFWQIDTKGKIRTGKIMLYNAITGKRIKESFDHIHWVHKLINQPDYELKQSLFGEHLLKDKTKHVAIVESEKTAIIASNYFPQFIWLAVGGKDGLNLEKLQSLNGRKVVLFPDLKYFEKWSGKAKDFNDRMIGTQFSVSDFLETNATEQERAEGWDIADYLIKFDYRQFRTEPASSKVEKVPVVECEVISFPIPVQAQEDAINWFNGHLLPYMNKTEICETLHF